jgi:Glycosyl hydrolase family 71
MRSTHFAALLLAVMPLASWASNSYVVPTTTLSAQTDNNTSAANGFTTQTNGNLGANNVSKVDIHTLLYSGNTTKVFAHLLLWFGQAGHMNVGYSSTDPTQVENQINDMVSRGIDGVVIDWYGANNSIDQATQLVMNVAEQHPGFTFAIMVDAGAIAQNLCSGCSPQQILIQQLQYVEQKYFSSSAYFTIQGQPVVTEFNIDDSYSIDWNAVNAALPTSPRFLFQDSAGFTHPLSDGSYSWVMPQFPNYGMSYLSGFYSAGLTHPNLETVGAAYKGFNDSLASWGTGRIMGQQCGQTWLQTFAQANGVYNSGTQLPYMQLVTWNDYEEGTEIESGIDNCLSLTGSISAGSLQWSINGNENTIDHYNAYISTDGQKLMLLTQAEPGSYSAYLCSFPIPAGSYQLFVQAVGKPNFANRITGPLTYTPSCVAASGSSQGLASSLTFTASPATVTVPSGKSGETTVTAVSQSGADNGSISLSCASLPSNLTCSFSPATIAPGSGTAISTLTISNSTTTAQNTHPQPGMPIYAIWFFSFGMFGFAFLADARARRRMLAVLLVSAFMGSTMLMSSCGGGSSGASTRSSASANTFTISVQGSSGASQISTSVVVIVQ